MRLRDLIGKGRDEHQKAVNMSLPFAHISLRNEDGLENQWPCHLIILSTYDNADLLEKMLEAARTKDVSCASLVINKGHPYNRGTPFFVRGFTPFDHEHIPAQVTEFLKALHHAGVVGERSFGGEAEKLKESLDLGAEP